MKFNFLTCKLEHIAEDITNYYIKNNILADSYWEKVILKSNFYKIIIGDNYAGYFAIYDENTLTLFAIFDKYKHISQNIFYEIKKLEQVSKAFLPTGDEFFLSHCLDSLKEINLIGYFTYDSKRKVEIKNDLELSIASPGDIDLINTLSSNYFDNLKEELLEGKIYIAKKDNKIVGFGHYNPGIILPHYISVGMYVIEKYRSKGNATKILWALKQLAYLEDKEPIAGCYYYNHNSLKTQLKIGNCSKTRLLSINF